MQRGLVGLYLEEMGADWYSSYRRSAATIPFEEGFIRKALLLLRFCLLKREVYFYAILASSF